MPAGDMTSGAVRKTAGDRKRIPMDFGNDPQLIAGARVTGTPTVTATPTTSPALTIAGVQLDYFYQVSALFGAGLAGQTYSVTFTITLDDADSSIVSRTAQLEVV